MVSKNTQIMIILYLIIIIFLFYQISQINNSNKIVESFNTKNTRIYGGNIHSLILSPYNDNINKYYGLFITNDKNKDITKSSYIYETNSLESNEFNNNATKETIIDNNISISSYLPGEILIDIFVDKYNRLMVIGISYDSNTKEVLYSVYRNIYSDLDGSELKFKWEKLTNKINIDNNPMRSFCYDINGDKLLGISAYDGQIYEQKYDNDNFEEWIGPINYDKKISMRKIMYNKNNQMIGIGLFDNYIYTKKNNNWRNSEWDLKNINRNKVYDLIYDNKGYLIATTPEGIKKQINQNVNSNFVPINSHISTNHNNLKLNKIDILKFKTGYELNKEDNIFYNENNDERINILGDSLKKIYDIKKLTKDLCSTKKYLRKTYIGNSNNNDNKLFNEIAIKNREISNLYEQIQNINLKLNK